MASSFPSTDPDRKSLASFVDDAKIAPGSVKDRNAASASVEAATADPELLQSQQTGVAKIEALHRVFGRGVSVWWLYISIGLLAYAYSLDQSTTSSYLPFATSAFGEHSIIGTITTAEAIITACGKPFIAKIADVTSRPTAYSVTLAFYLLGYIVIASASSVGAVAAGMVMYTVGHTGLDLVTDIIIADLSPLKWRGLMTSFASAPFIVNAFVSAEIVDAVLGGPGWRWGYGMFAIILPAVMAPGIVVLFWADYKAKHRGLISFSASPAERRRLEALKATGAIEAPVLPSGERFKFTLVDQIKEFVRALDIGGLVLLCFAFSLLLLPITLAKSAENGWHNPSMIAMEVVGGVCLILFVLYERYGTSQPLMPRRILFNKTFICAVGIDVFYFMSGTMRSTYLSSYVYIVKDFGAREWVYYGNTQSVALSVFGIVAGLILRYTHRYKYLQISGLCIRIVGMGLTVHARKEATTIAELVWTQILIGMGGAFSVVGSRVASQASVPHQDLASVIALLSLWTQLGSAIGGAIAAGVWTNTMPRNLQKYLPGVPQSTIDKLYGSLTSVRKYARGSDIRNGVTKAYEVTMLPLLIAALCVSFLPLVCAVLMTNYYLGDTQNAVDGTTIDGRKILTEEEIAAQNGLAPQYTSEPARRGWWPFSRRAYMIS